MLVIRSSIFLTICFLFTGCKNSSIYVAPINPELLVVNDSIDRFLELHSEMIQKIEDVSSYDNPITTHFSKYISKKDLQNIHFEESQKNIYIEFTLDFRRKLKKITSNATSSKLDKHLKKAFKKFDLNLLNITNFNSRHKYNLVIIQNIDDAPVVKCNLKPISYTPPIYRHCSDKMSYENLHNCNYAYITDYLNNNVNLSSITNSDILNNLIIHPKFIIDENGKVVAAKIESQNKEFVESYYKALMEIPNAEVPAKVNGTNYYYGYNFPTRIKKIIRNSRGFRHYYYQRRYENITPQQLMEEYISSKYGTDLK